MKEQQKIDKCLGLLRQAWYKNLNQRFGQMLTNIASDQDLFYVEDEELIILIEKEVKRKEFAEMGLLLERDCEVFCGNCEAPMAPGSRDCGVCGSTF